MKVLILQGSPRANGSTEDSGIVTAKLDEQKTEETKAKIAQIVKNL